MTLYEIIKKGLADNGYNGLCSVGLADGCGCSCDDLMPCNSRPPFNPGALECVPAYAYRPNRGETCKGCEDSGGACPFKDTVIHVSFYEVFFTQENHSVKCRAKKEDRDGN
jgi:hypothetical protein